MKNKYVLKVFLSLLIGLFLSGCEKDPIALTNAIDLKGSPEVYESLNEDATLEIPFSITLEKGVKRAFYKVVTSVANSYKIIVGPEIEIPVTDGKTLDTVLSIQVVANLKSIVIAVIDNDNVLTPRTIMVDEVKKAPLLSFKNGIKHQKTVMVGTPFNVEGNVSSENELTRMSYITVANNQQGNTVAIGLGDKKNVDFSVDVPVPDGLEYVIFEAENEFGGIARDTFTVSNVVTEDFIKILMHLGITELDPFFAELPNKIIGNIDSWTNITSFEYSIVKDGTEGSRQSISLSGNPGNDYDFSFDITGQQGMQQIILYAENEGGKTATVVLNIPKVSKITDVTLTKIKKTKWKIIDFDSEHPPYLVKNVIDDDLSSFWHTPYNDATKVHPHWFIVDMGEEVSIGVIEVFRRLNSTNGPSLIQLLYSQNGTDWNDFGTFPMNRDINEGQRYYCATVPVFPTARYIKFVALESPNYFTMVGELSVYFPEY